MTFDESSSVITRIARLQNATFDHTGHVWQGMTRAEVRTNVDEIGRLRTLVNWRPLDMVGRWSPRKYRKVS